MNKKTIWIIAAIVVVVGGAIGAYAMTQKDAGAPSNPSTSNTGKSGSGKKDSNKKAAATITYSDSGYSPSTITVKSGDTIAIKNTSSSEMQFDSDPHPIHTDDEELNAGPVAPGQTVTFTVTTTGTYGYHNHLNPNDTGTIVIK
ncbi:MAG TPA: cupredoxin domain-containing protein [Candidatus Saccharimonadales bacterium]|nr:cupredoxin domain-containing protein [Candidatus Saccharimonadales bacterium]